LGLIVFGCVFSLFFITSLYMQQVLGYSALKTGLAYLPLALLTIFAATGASQAVTKIGPKWVLAVGLILLGGALLVFSRAGTSAKYASDLLPGFVMAGLGLGLSVVPIQVSAFSGVDERESGLAAGLVNTSQELGGALKVAVLATVAFSRFNHFMASHGGDPTLIRAGLDEGFKLAFTVAACLIGLALIAALTLLVPRPHHPPENAHGVLRRFSPKPTHQHRWPHPHLGHGNGAGSPVATKTDAAPTAP
jgi:MFS family permease